jgi:hypothetical protein
VVPPRKLLADTFQFFGSKEFGQLTWNDLWVKEPLFLFGCNE